MNRYLDQAELIVVLEIIVLVLQGVATVGFISVPSIFYIAAQESNDDPDKVEETENYVTKILIICDLVFVSLFVAQAISFSNLKAGVQEKNPGKLKPWLYINTIMFFAVWVGTIPAIVKLTWAIGLHIANFMFLLYRWWSLLTIYLFMKELRESAVTAPQTSVQIINTTENQSQNLNQNQNQKAKRKYSGIVV